MKVLVTGVAGTGKSTILNALNKLEYTTVELDAHRAWCDIKTDQFMEADFTPPSGAANYYVRTVDTSFLDKLPKSYSANPIFICGNYDNIESLFPHMDMIFLLTTEWDILVQRYENRSNSYGSKSKDRKKILRLMEQQNSSALKAGAIVIDTSHQPIGTTVSQILNQTEGAA